MQGTVLEKVVLLLFILALTANVSAISQHSLGVKNGDWVEYGFEDAFSSGERWQKLEFQEVSDANATVHITTHFSEGIEVNETNTIDLLSDSDFQMIMFSARVHVIPANLTTGDSVFLGQFGNRTITGETTNAYADADRKIIYANFTEQSQYTFYWDKQTGVLAEGIMVTGNAYKRIWITGTNMWTAESSSWPWATITIIAALVALGLIVMRKSIIRRLRKEK